MKEAKSGFFASLREKLSQKKKAPLSAGPVVVESDGSSDTDTQESSSFESAVKSFGAAVSNCSLSNYNEETIAVAIKELSKLKKIDPNDSYVWDLLNTAVWNDRKDVVVLLFAKGLKADDRSGAQTQDSTPLHFAALAGNKEISLFIAQQGSDLSAVDSENRTPSMLAAQCGCHDVAELLKPAQVSAFTR